ncbi:uronate isomerase [Levilactobacillus zymae]|uniref:Uronate isomerase n=1 Tax=Levilactobacillus zymae TaxID=267363 RepID=A0ABQ0WVM2_9LACO|nr:glucuronate isomerase [Levilactobacillus zymae]KRL07616.1 glucuronate isomerase [Levilactobacillus zymae DSM 19395]QFR62082.1 glucuronate isomerase [Levilactobacillus zymae]GEO71552.1 uronate isomerase [Levilactobacillus zymae]
MTLLNEDFLLTNDPAKTLYHDYAENMPIIDYHCHLEPKDIYENKNYPNITRLWLNDGSLGDHYKWRLERANGVPEDLITGDGDEYQKFLAWAGTIEKSIGNPLYEWTHLELKRFFGIDEPLNTKSAPAIWKKANELVQSEAFKPRNLIKNMNVKVACTTDDPASDLHYHKLIREDEAENGFKVLPAMRPDNLVRINQGDFGAYLKKLGDVAGVEITDYDSLVKALDNRFKFFTEMGGRLSDHGLNSYHFRKISKDEFNQILAKAAKDNTQLTAAEVDGYTTLLLEELMRLNKQYDFTMQYHMNVLRNANGPMFRKLGADAGFDSMGSEPGIAGEIMALLSDMAEENNIPKTILFSTNPNDWLELATGMQSFQGEVKQKLQLGCAWWFNDTREGMHDQLRIMAQQSLLPNFVGMLTDSRSFLSYPRHEYFRRVLCDLIGEWVVRGQVPDDYAYLGQIVQDISYNNAKNYFGFFK